MAPRTLRSLIPSKWLIASYVFDWIAIIAIAAVSLVLSRAHPNHRPFSLVDLNISFPRVDETITMTILYFVVGVIPAVIIFLVSLLIVPARSIEPNTPSRYIWRRKLWEWFAGWMGLALSIALASLFTQGMKNLFGKPRPSCLARCLPDTSAIQQYSQSSYAAQFNPEWVLVDWKICQQTDNHILQDAFRSFPSGHASSSWSGLFYLSLFLCSKFGVVIPYLPSRTVNDPADDPILSYAENDDSTSYNPTEVSARQSAAAPPVYLLALPLVPIAVAIYVTSTRFYEFYHFGIDLIAGSIIGILSSWFAFRMYHMPLSRGSGWAWGGRSKDRAFFLRIGHAGFATVKSWKNEHAAGDRDHDQEQLIDRERKRSDEEQAIREPVNLNNNITTGQQPMASAYDHIENGYPLTDHPIASR